MERQRIGRDAEDAAVRFLECRGLTVLLRNYRRRLGELDIVAREGDILVALDGAGLSTLSDLQRALGADRVGASTLVTLIRRGERVVLSITPEEAP